MSEVIVLLLVSAIVMIYEWRYLKKRRMDRRTYMLSLGIYVMSVGYAAWVMLYDISAVTTPNLVIHDIFRPIQYIITLEWLTT
ncbi:hypothetical protein HXA32_02490 [Salipaludibacillus agaradhaerens]|uniref:hypothetical protein n=1 Tax=Salipaludibacillus agaradhaerens TaxID=76935 RepID=UPI0021512FDC|nr:hypothetical protein [Salipaludibacillus agaradhaerens]MCR6105149.1 hypothetical protein [Salipaludibacillus agaradhaerens]